MAVVGRHTDNKRIPATAAVRHNSLCRNHVVHACNASSGNRREPPCHTMASANRHNLRTDSGTGQGRTEIRGIHIRSGRNIEPRHINILYPDLHQPPGMIEKHLFAVFSFKQRDVFITPFNHCVYNRYQGHS